MKRLAGIFFAIGRPFAPLYSLLMRLRALCYRKSFLLSSTRLPVPVISIGNLTMGGTGKTPMVLYLSRFLLGRGRRPAIVSRGYGGRAGGAVRVVAASGKIFLDPEQAGDEPVMLAEALPEVPVLIGPRRALVARRAIEEFGVDSIVMDDGFQHLALHRDLDLVLFGARTLLGNGRVFPGGVLREPFSALARASAFVVTGVDGDNRAAVEKFRGILGHSFPATPVFLGEYLPSCLLHSGGEGTFPVDQAKKKPFFAFAGIANPESFHQTLKRERFGLKGFKAFNDHHRYTDRDMSALIEAALAAGARALLTTEKDFVKLKPFFGDFPVFALKIELLMGDDFDLFLADALRRVSF